MQDSTTEVEKPNIPISCPPGKKGKVPQTYPTGQICLGLALQLLSFISWVGDGGSAGARPAFQGGGMGGAHTYGFQCLVVAAEGSSLGCFALKSWLWF